MGIDLEKGGVAEKKGVLVSSGIPCDNTEYRTGRRKAVVDMKSGERLYGFFLLIRLYRVVLELLQLFFSTTYCTRFPLWGVRCLCDVM